MLITQNFSSEAFDSTKADEIFSVFIPGIEAFEQPNTAYKITGWSVDLLGFEAPNGYGFEGFEWIEITLGQEQMPFPASAIPANLASTGWNDFHHVLCDTYSGDLSCDFGEAGFGSFYDFSADMLGWSYSGGTGAGFDIFNPLFSNGSAEGVVFDFSITAEAELLSVHEPATAMMLSIALAMIAITKKLRK